MNTLAAKYDRKEVSFISINVDPASNCGRPPQMPNVCGQTQNLCHVWTDKKGFTNLKVHFVPFQMIVDKDFNVLEKIDGTQNRVVGGSHGRSRFYNVEETINKSLGK